MIHSPLRRLVLVHPPKTGGTAMALALGEAEGDAVARDGRRDRGLGKHATLAEVEAALGSVPAGWLVLATARNPWDRVVSLWAWARVQAFRHPTVERAKAMGFGDFVRDPATQREMAASPARRWLSGRAGVVLRIEHPEDLGPVEAHLGRRVVVPRANESARERDWRGYYDRETRAIVARACAEDVRLGGYSFEP